MNTNLRGRSDRFESIARGMLALALIAGVAWALAHGGPMPGPSLGLSVH
mgnify:CR=1 FL=1